MAANIDSSPASDGRRQRWMIILSMALVALATLIFYRQALQFGYFNDDPTGHFAWMEGKSTADFFRSSADYGYYRPVVFAVLRATQTLAGGHVAPVDHGLLLLLHAANVALVWLLAYRLGRGQWAYAWVAALAFLAFPFNYEAVTYVASLTHPLLLFWLLLTLHLYIWGRAAERLWPLVIAWLTLVAGLLTHENGLIALPALAGVEWLLFRPPSWQAWLRPIWPFAVPVLLYVPLWLAIPKDSETAALSPVAMGSNAVPFLQSLVYPLLSALRLESSDVGLLVLAAVAFLGLTAVLAWRSAAVGLWLFGLGWFVLSALPAMLFLSPDYLYGSPRLSYLPAVGIALLWGIPALWLWCEPMFGRFEGSLSEVVRVALVAGLVLLVIIPPQRFIRCELDFYQSASDIVAQMAAAAQTTPPDQTLTFVNLPYFFSSTSAHPDGCPSPYPWTPVGAVVVPPYAQAHDFVRFNGGPDRPTTAVTFDGYNAGWRTVGEPASPEWLRELVETGQVHVFDLLSESLADLGAAWQPGGPEGVAPIAAFEGGLNLLDARAAAHSDAVNVTLQWHVGPQMTLPPAGTPAVFVHLYGPDGALVAQADAPPGRGLVPVSLWQAGDVISDSIRLAIDGQALAAGTYAVRVGLYDPQTGERLTVTSELPIVDNALEIDRFER